MTQEDKELLLKDLCGRLPYGFLYQVIYDNRTPQMPNKIIIDGEFTLFDGWQVNEFKPYLRPMSSMTEEEKENFQNFIFPACNDPVSMLDWLNSHHFDYRSLIEKGIALEAPERMYKNE